MGRSVSLLLVANRPGDPTRGMVPSLTFDIVAGGEVVGEIVLRNGDTDALQRYAGHVGYAVFPKHRNRGYATEALLQLLPIARSAGLKELWITCSLENASSRRVVEKVGACFVEVVELPPSAKLYVHGDRWRCRYRIALGEHNWELKLGARTVRPPFGQRSREQYD